MFNDDDHPSVEEWERFVFEELTSDEYREVILHLLSGCEECRALVRELWDVDFVEDGEEWGGAGEAAELSPLAESSRFDYSGALDRLIGRALELQGRLEEERAKAPTLADELARHPKGRRRLLIANSSRFASWGLCELFLERSFEARFDDPAESEALAELAVEIADRLSPEVYGRLSVADLRAWSWSYLGNARRIRSDLRGADEAFVQAQDFLEEGSADPHLRGDILYLMASLRCDQRRFAEALKLLDRALRLYRRAEEFHLVGLALAQKGAVLGDSGRPEEAVPVLEQALPLIDASDTQARLNTQHNLVLFLAEAGRYEEAEKALHQVRPLLAQRKERTHLLRLRWVEGKIAQGLGRLEAAQAAFLEVRDGFIDHGIAYDAALVSLDLAEAYARLGKRAEMRLLAEEMVPIFQSRDIGREALAALAVFQQAARTEEASLDLIESVATYLKRSRYDPKAQFEPPG